MEYYTTLLLLLAILITTIQCSKILFGKSKLPPGPKPWPIIGNILKLGDNPHLAVAELVKIYGPIMSLKLGSKTTIVISSPEVAKEMFLNHDLALSSKFVPEAEKAENHDKFSMIWLPSASPKRTNLRKIATIQLFTSRQLNMSQDIRQKKVKELVEYVQQCSEKGLPVNIGKAAFTTSLNLLSNTLFSVDLASHVSSNTQEFKDLIWSILEECGRANLSDLFPLLKKLDLQGALKRTSGYFKKLLGIFEEIIVERLKDPTDVKDDVLGTLLKLVKDQEMSVDDIRHMLVDLFIAGTDTTSNALEWAMTELLRNPEIMKKAQIELDQVLGKDGSILQESDITNLPYIDAIMKETMRLHPVGPFLVPRKAEEKVLLCGYWIPKDSIIWVNIWSIGRDPSVWPNPNMFSPERFIERNIDIKGQDFKLIPFGSGRRMCPAMPLANRMVHLMLATLIHSFNWNAASPKAIDIEEKFGLTLQKVEPLQAIPLPK
ncbi:cytochrome P450 76AD1-like [Chenopodium quinoa]|uniref:Cytochrome P450 n=1 Tax=Chenopodium quinoa TaxID=63459 RepID=A0A803LPR6_CHEQI|nr:cytochrome P450 76AD1-like [Chenopodium quinoa]